LQNADQSPDGSGDVITLDHVHKMIGSFTAVHDANFGIRSGEFFAMILLVSICLMGIGALFGARRQRRYG